MRLCARHVPRRDSGVVHRQAASCFAIAYRCTSRTWRILEQDVFQIVRKFHLTDPVHPRSLALIIQEYSLSHLRGTTELSNLSTRLLEECGVRAQARLSAASQEHNFNKLFKCTELLCDLAVHLSDLAPRPEHGRKPHTVVGCASTCLTLPRQLDWAHMTPEDHFLRQSCSIHLVSTVSCVENSGHNIRFRNGRSRWQDIFWPVSHAPSRTWLHWDGHGRPGQSRLQGRHRCQTSSTTWFNPPGRVPHTPTGCHLLDRCHRHSRVHSSET